MIKFLDVLNLILLIIQFLAAITGCLYFFKLKKDSWKWFSVYLIFISFQDTFWAFNVIFSSSVREVYYLFVGIPIEFLFLYWLYAKKSLNKKFLFLVFSAVLIGTILLMYSFKSIGDANSLVLNLGSLMLTILLVLEYLKQIKNDNILNFQENKMFYINLGVILFYFGSLPFHAFQKYLYKDYKVFVEFYYMYFIISNCLMYLLFIASFIWGKERSS